MTYSTNDIVLLDSHVHIYQCFDLSSLLDAAFDNFKSEAARRGRSNAFVGILLLTETAGMNEFSRLLAGASPPQRHQKVKNGWSFRTTAENCSLLAQRGSDEHLILIAGRQIVTAENLEVLALCTASHIQDGLPLRQTVHLIRKARALAVVPWGPGKWLGKRGALLTQFLQSDASVRVFLGDNGGRPEFWRPYHFELARSRGIRILPGSDPLPFRSESWRPGSFGFALAGVVSKKRPAADTKQLLADDSVAIHPYGKFERPLRFVRNQLLMRLPQSCRAKPNKEYAGNSRH